MNRVTVISRAQVLVLAVLLVVWAIYPYTARAQQASSDLQAAIKSALLSDPRTSGLSQLEVEGIVVILADEAGKRGITVEDLQWRPQNTEDSFSAGSADDVASDTCGTSLLCAFNEAFGFVGPDQTIPYILGVASMGLIWIVAEMRHRRRHPPSN
jgi:hypothetical protein